MADPLRHPDTGAHEGLGSDQSSTGNRSWGSVLGVVVVGGVLLLFVLLHLTGTIGPGSH